MKDSEPTRNLRTPSKKILPRIFLAGSVVAGATGGVLGFGPGSGANAGEEVHLTPEPNVTAQMTATEAVETSIPHEAATATTTPTRPAKVTPTGTEEIHLTPELSVTPQMTATEAQETTIPHGTLTITPIPNPGPTETESATAIASATAPSTPGPGAIPTAEQQGQLKELKFNDRDRNGLRDAGEEGLIEQFRVVRDKDGNAIKGVITQGDGTSIQTVESGKYQVCEVEMQGWEPTTQTGLCQDVEVEPNKITEAVFGNAQKQLTPIPATPVSVAPPAGGLPGAGNGGSESARTLASRIALITSGILGLAGFGSLFGVNAWDVKRKTVRVAIRKKTFEKGVRTN